MAGVNKAIIVGRLGQDPELRYTSNGTAVATFNVATSFEWKNKDSGERNEKTEWHRIVAFKQRAEICGEYLKKGRQVYIDGRLQTRSWEKDGITRYVTEIVANEIQFLGSNNGSGSSGRGRSDGGANHGYPEPPVLENLEDDIPF